MKEIWKKLNEFIKKIFYLKKHCIKPYEHSSGEYYSDFIGLINLDDDDKQSSL